MFSLDVFCYPGGATLAGSWTPFCSSFEVICCRRAPFFASVCNFFARFRGQLYAHQFFHAPHSAKEPTGFQSGNKKLAPPIQNLLQICCKKKRFLLTADAAQSAALKSSVYIYIYLAGGNVGGIYSPCPPTPSPKYNVNV